MRPRYREGGRAGGLVRSPSATNTKSLTHTRAPCRTYAAAEAAVWRPVDVGEENRAGFQSARWVTAAEMRCREKDENCFLG